MNKQLSTTILIVDDDKEVRYSLKRVLAREGYDIHEASSGEEGLKVAGELRPVAMLLDNRMGGMSGMEVLQNLRAVVPDSAIIMMTAFGTTQTAIEAMKYGAYDYLIKPFEPARLLEVVGKAVLSCRERESAGEAAETTINVEDFAEGIVGTSDAMQLVLKQIGQVTASDATVMITGESGTGKELIARCICKHSHRARKPFIAVNCAAIPDNLIESELFGHEKGAFTGATAQRIGKFEMCDGGTIFLDEIGDMALPTQTKILRALQEGEIQRVGGTETIKVNVRLVAATNKDLEDMVAERTFREDLYYRLNVFRIRVPALRERPGDIPLIAEFHLQKLAKEGKTPRRRLSREALETLLRHSWPGNVRELENVIFRSAVVSKGETIFPTDLPAEVTGGDKGRTVPAANGRPGDLPLDALLDEVYQRLARDAEGRVLADVERAMVERAFAGCEKNQGRAAGVLGITRGTLRNRLEQYELK